METIFEQLKRLQKIAPDPLYAKRSRDTILGGFRQPAYRTFTGWLFHNLQMGATVALAGLTLFIVLAGFSLWRTFSPLSAVNLNLSSLRAEAQAIDIQIQLANLGYVPPPRVAQSTPALAFPTTMPSSSPASSAAPAAAHVAASSTTPAATSTVPLTIDAALQKLSE